eukprot:CAMPEP_0196771410 /NCGR_PEP_ID=MMETSP1104-20130614/1672_1 /TAXON_ID=33652 /ORGANISM="Cafeteria sp., Strain Caron Lab Isolate" /LENGTH=311 /DNA_ID=CAMNT_0042141529 /DNA_START=144 /DNA_END=1079 /DNA_ORIENTATION=+
MTNKAVMRVHGFNYVLSLTTAHFAVTYVALSVAAGMGVFAHKHVPPSRAWVMAAAGVASIVFMNFSLSYNSVGFYQVTKLMCIPCIVAMQQLQGKVFSTRVKTTLVVVLLGVGIATVTDVELNTAGFLFSIVAVLSTAQFQIWQGDKQREFGLNAIQMTLALAPYQAALTGTAAFFFEIIATPSVLDYQFTLPSGGLVLLSCFLAVAVNLCSFGLIGKTSAVTYQVVGHAKTCLILIFGFLLYPVAATKGQLLRNLAGIVIAMTGVIAYGRVKLQESAVSSSPPVPDKVTSDPESGDGAALMPLKSRDGSS